VHSPAPATLPDPSVTPDRSEHPLFFEADGRPLYGVFHPPQVPRPGAPLVLDCHSLGVEQLTVYRNAVRLARAAAAAGFPVFRYHARGHGDSSGDFASVTLETLVEDALAAADDGLRRSGATRIVWIGERLGALVAALAIRRRDDAAALALWEPVHRPRDYFRAMLRGMLFSRVSHGERPSETVDQLFERLEREGRVDVHGYYLHRELVTSAADADLAAALAEWRGPTLLAQVQARPKLSPPNDALVKALAARGVAVEVIQVAEEPGWHFISNPAWESEPLVSGTEGWLRGLA